MQHPSLKYQASLLNVLILSDGCDSIEFVRLSKKLFKSVQECSAQDTPSLLEYDEYHLLVLIGEDTFLSTAKFSILENISAYNTLVLSPSDLAFDTYKNALHHNAYYAHKLPANENEFVKLMRSALAPLVELYVKQKEQHRYEEIVRDAKQLYIIYDKSTPTYISDAVEKFFGVQSLEDFSVHEINVNLCHYLEKSLDANQVLGLQRDQNYLVSRSGLKDGSTLVHISEIDNVSESSTSNNQLLDRLSFIEELKDTFISRTFESQTTPLIIVHVDNHEDIVKNNGILTYNDILIDFSKLTSTLCQNNVKLSQWTKNVICVLAPSMEVEKIKDEMKKIQDSASIELNASGVPPVFHSYIVDVNSLDLNLVVELIDNVDNKNLTQNSLSGLEHFEISSTTDKMENEHEILYYLEKQMLAKSEVKLLNFYKGLSINTPSRLIKIDGENVYIRQEKIQGYAMKLDGTVSIQSPHMPMDILAKVKLIDINKKVAILSDFEALKESANSRRHIRVSSDHRMHVSISAGRNVFSASVMDISIKSMACKVSLGKVIPELGSKVKVQFQLPSKRFEEGMVTMVLTTKLSFVLETNEYVKLVLDLELIEPYESYLLEYIYERQQTLIKEVKQIALKL